MDPSVHSALPHPADDKLNDMFELLSVRNSGRGKRERVSVCECVHACMLVCVYI